MMLTYEHLVIAIINGNVDTYLGDMDPCQVFEQLSHQDNTFLDMKYLESSSGSSAVAYVRVREEESKVELITLNPDETETQIDQNWLTLVALAAKHYSKHTPELIKLLLEHGARDCNVGSDPLAVYLTKQLFTTENLVKRHKTDLEVALRDLTDQINSDVVSDTLRSFFHSSPEKQLSQIRDLELFALLWLNARKHESRPYGYIELCEAIQELISGTSEAHIQIANTADRLASAFESYEDTSAKAKILLDTVSIISDKVDLTRRDENGNTALHIGILAQNSDLVDVLLKAANPQNLLRIYNNAQELPFMWAVRMYLKEIREEAKSSTVLKQFLKAYEGRSPFMLAARIYLKEIGEKLTGSTILKQLIEAYDRRSTSMQDLDICVLEWAMQFINHQFQINPSSKEINNECRQITNNLLDRVASITPNIEMVNKPRYITAVLTAKILLECPYNVEEVMGALNDEVITLMTPKQLAWVIYAVAQYPHNRRTVIDMAKHITESMVAQLDTSEAAMMIYTAIQDSFIRGSVVRFINNILTAARVKEMNAQQLIYTLRMQGYEHCAHETKNTILLALTEAFKSMTSVQLLETAHLAKKEHYISIRDSLILFLAEDKLKKMKSIEIWTLLEELPKVYKDDTRIQHAFVRMLTMDELQTMSDSQVVAVVLYLISSHLALTAFASKNKWPFIDRESLLISNIFTLTRLSRISNSDLAKLIESFSSLAYEVMRERFAEVLTEYRLMGMDENCLVKILTSIKEQSPGISHSPTLVGRIAEALASKDISSDYLLPIMDSIADLHITRPALLDKVQRRIFDIPMTYMWLDSKAMQELVAAAHKIKLAPPIKFDDSSSENVLMKMSCENLKRVIINIKSINCRDQRLISLIERVVQRKLAETACLLGRHMRDIEDLHIRRAEGLVSLKGALYGWPMREPELSIKWKMLCIIEALVGRGEDRDPRPFFQPLPDAHPGIQADRDPQEQAVPAIKAWHPTITVWPMMKIGADLHNLATGWRTIESFMRDVWQLNVAHVSNKALALGVGLSWAAKVISISRATITDVPRPNIFRAKAIAYTTFAATSALTHFAISAYNSTVIATVGSVGYVVASASTAAYAHIPNILYGTVSSVIAGSLVMPILLSSIPEHEHHYKWISGSVATGALVVTFVISTLYAPVTASLTIGAGMGYSAYLLTDYALSFPFVKDAVEKVVTSCSSDVASETLSYAHDTAQTLVDVAINTPINFPSAALAGLASLEADDTDL